MLLSERGRWGDVEIRKQGRHGRKERLTFRGDASDDYFVSQPPSFLLFIFSVGSCNAILSFQVDVMAPVHEDIRGYSLTVKSSAQRMTS